MRSTLAFASLFLLSGFLPAQVNVVSGYAGYNQPYCGYGQPFVPLVNTPSASPENPFATPESAYFASPSSALSAEAYSAAYAPVTPTDVVARGNEGADGHFNLGAATFENSYSVAELAAMSPKPGPPVRVFTNKDVEALHQTNDQSSSNSNQAPTK